MAGNKYIALIAGKLKEVAAILTSAGAADANKIPALDSTGRLDNSFMPVGIVAETKDIICSENLSAGNLVNVYLNSGVLNSRKADATSPAKYCIGYVLSAFTSGSAAKVYFDGHNTAQSGLTPGDELWLSNTTPGAVMNSAAGLTAGQISQRIGLALTATESTFEPPIVVELA